MTSRLDRLFILLESGTSPVTRRAAAKQIGEVQKLYPHELHNLLNRLIGYLHSQSWDTRIAAAQSIESILQNVPQWQPESFAFATHEKSELFIDDASCSSRGSTEQNHNHSHAKVHQLTFDSFDLGQILCKGARLMGSEGKEFDLNDNTSLASGSVAAAERLSRQRALLNDKLGLTNAAALGLNVSEMFTDDDIQNDVSTYNVNAEKVPVEDILCIKPKEIRRQNNGQKMSCREINRAKRKARQTHSSSQSASNGSKSSSGCDEIERKKAKTNEVQQIYYNVNDPVPDVTGIWLDAVDWPLENFCARLYLDLFSAKWETRHGAATALRELINHHSKGAGKSSNMSLEGMNRSHNAWLEDAVLRLLCVLCLDRFGDYVSDTVVAPVRETCAQVLGTVVKDMVPEKVHHIVQILLKLLKQKEWEVRHAGLLGLKYVLVVREDLLPICLPATINDILVGLFDSVDDVGAVAAATLIPVASWLPKLLNPEQVSSIVKMLWDLLLDHDELTSACNSFMGLLAAILSLPNAANWIQMESMTTLVPRLYPFLSHNTSSVRKSTLITLRTLTQKVVSIKKEDEEKEEKTNSSSLAGSNKTSVIVLVKRSSRASDTKDDKSMQFDSKNLQLNLGVSNWPAKLLQDTLRYVYQRILVEPQEGIQKLALQVFYNLIENSGDGNLSALLHAACPFVSTWICLAMQPAYLPFDSNLLITPVPRTTTTTTTTATTTATTTTASSMTSTTKNSNIVDVASSSSNSGSDSSALAALQQRRSLQRASDALLSHTLSISLKLYLGGSEVTPLDVRERNCMPARISASRVLGALSRYLVLPAPGITYTDDMVSPIDCYTKVLMGHLNSRSNVQRLVCALIIAFWAQTDPKIRPGPPKLCEKLHACVSEYVYYDETAVTFTRLLQETRDLILTLKQYKVPIEDFGNTRILTMAQIESLATKLIGESLRATPTLKPKTFDMLEDRRRALYSSLQQTASEQNAYNTSVQAALAGALVCLHSLPEKLNPIVKPLMESIKREDCELLQELSAEFLVHLMELICDRQPSPNNKILTNLSMLLKSDAEYTPKIPPIETTLQETVVPDSAYNECIFYGVLTITLQQQPANLPNTRNSNANGYSGSTTPTATATRGPGRPSLAETLASAAALAATLTINNEQANEDAKLCRIQRVGATYGITKLCRRFGAELFTKISVFQEIMFTKINNFFEKHNSEIDTLYNGVIPDASENNDLITALQLIEVAAEHLDVSLHERLFGLLPKLGQLVKHPLKAIRHMSARCIAALAFINPCKVMDFIINEIVGLLNKIELIIQRQGAIETIERVVDKLQIRIVPYIVLLVVPLLGCMSDPDESVRLLSTHCFANLIQLMPLDSRSNSGLHKIESADLQARKTRDRQFLEYLFTPKTIPDYKVPVQLSVELRNYQQAGVNWLWFLNKYNLHGILCDDMGLGKTLQAICILSGDHYQRMQDRATALPSLVICPPTLTGHWVYEIEKFLQNSGILKPLHYVGLPVMREKLRSLIGRRCNLIVASYDTIRKDIDFFSLIHWNYCILDEGHIIKNGKTKCSKAIKLLKAQHRLILSGTPIQNNVLELWSLFDFLMPGFLGTERQFIAKYSRPILASRDSKSSAKEQEAGVLAMEALHRQVLPFLLRRVKEDVLKDLPPKITQDLLCELSPLQQRLYEDFSNTHLSSDLKDRLAHLGDAGNIDQKTHIFHALRYLQNVCNHPKLVLTPKHPEFSKITQELDGLQSSLNEIDHSAKLPALKQLLLDCGIGVQTESVSQHRALIFCQLKAMLDIVEKDLLRKHLPTVTYLRLDGSVPASLRQDIVNNFNTDPSIDVLLLTTQVGGLGLNLTGADTVIFVEHDWNPMKDLQAMDRAHRIGQKKVVNVYRLITRKSLEEKIMSLQKFKILTANTVVSSENASLETMGTEQLFDLFNLNEQNRNGSTASGDQQQSGNRTSGGHVSLNNLLEGLPELWSEKEYDEEYDLSNFVQSLRK